MVSFYSITLNRVNELNEKAAANIQLTLVGNKCDLESQRQVKQEEALEYAKTLGLSYHEVSAKADIGIDKLFNDIAKQLPKESMSKKKSTLNLKKTTETGGSSYCQC